MSGMREVGGGKTGKRIWVGYNRQTGVYERVSCSNMV